MWMLVHLIHLVLTSETPFIWDILYSFLIKTHVVVFVPSTPAKWISFHKHRNRKVVGGKYNVLVFYVNASAPSPSGVVLCNPFIWDILYSFLIKNHVVVSVPSTKAKWISFRNHRSRKVVGGKHNVLVSHVDVCAPDPPGVVLLKPLQMRYFVVHFDWKSWCLCAFHNNEMNIIPQQHEHKSCRRQAKGSSKLCGC